MWNKKPEVKPPLPASETQPLLSAPTATPAPAPLRPEPPRAEAPRPEMKSDASHVSRGICIKGEVTGSSDLLLDGQVEGTVRLGGACVTLGPNSRARANVSAREIIVEGALEGSLEARERVQIRRSGRVTGNVTSPRLAIEEGAVLRGHVEMAAPGSARNAAIGPPPKRDALAEPVPIESAN
jgi:cytoskeletal protein CcmA (bactofilin family)